MTTLSLLQSGEISLEEWESEIRTQAISSRNSDHFENIENGPNIFWRMCVLGVISYDEKFQWTPVRILDIFVAEMTEDADKRDKYIPGQHIDRLVLTIQRLRYLYAKFQRLEKSVIDKCVNSTNSPSNGTPQEKPRLTIAAYTEESVWDTYVPAARAQASVCAAAGDGSGGVETGENLTVDETEQMYTMVLPKSDSNLPAVLVDKDNLSDIRRMGMLVMKTILDAMSELNERIESVRKTVSEGREPIDIPDYLSKPHIVQDGLFYWEYKF
jgi:hypothetical protein